MILVILIQDEYLERWYIEDGEKGEVGDFSGRQWLRLTLPIRECRLVPYPGTRSHPQAVWCSQNFLERRSRGKAMSLQAGRLYIAD